MGSSGGKPQGGKKGQNPFRSGTAGFEGGGNFWDFQAKPVAGMNQFQQAAGRMAGGLGGVGQGNLANANKYLQQLGSGGSGFLNRAMSAAGKYTGGNLPGQFGQAEGLNKRLGALGNKQVTGANIQSDPAYLAAQKAFTQSQLPLIQNQAALAGLGRSSAMTNAVAHGNAQAMLPMIQDALGREERGIGRQISTTQQGIGNLMNVGQANLGQNNQAMNAYLQGAGQEANQLSQAASGSAGLAGQEFGQASSQMQALQNVGNQARGVEQEQLDAPYNEQQRLWGEALNSMYGPLSFLGNMGGATSTQSKK
jgi:hypothetical protein